MTSLSPTVTREFTGVLVIDDESIPATLHFESARVQLAVAGELIGDWTPAEVELIPVDPGVDIRAEGDVVRFVPHRRDDLNAFLGFPSADPRSDVSVGDDTSDGASGPFSGLLDELPTGEGSLITDERHEEGLFADSEPVPIFESVFADPAPDDQDTTDNGSTENDTPVTDAEITPDWPVEAVEPIETPTEAPNATQGPFRTPEDAEPEWHPIDDPYSGYETAATVVSRPPTVADEDSHDTEPTAEEDEAPEPLSDEENTRQWLLVAAGGVVLVVIVAVVVWGIVSVLRSGPEAMDQTPEPQVTAPTTPPTTPAPAVTSQEPPTTVSPENAAAAAAFVEGWNELANQYAYHLSIDGDSLPLSIAATPSVHLTYTEDGQLELTMAPRGTGSDRDLLLAMGLAVAWADPTISPEGRRDLLGSLGVDVNEPNVEAMGGELTRNGVSYRLSVSDSVIHFEVAPTES